MRGMARDDQLARLRLRRILDLIAERFDGSSTAFAKAIGKSPSQVSHWTKGVRNPNGDTCRQLEIALDLPWGWCDQDYDSSVAHAVSDRQPIVTPKTIVWEDLKLDLIEGQFLMAVKGDALMPTYPPGQMAIWQAGDASTANPGQAVLVHVPDRGFELRFLERRGSTWAGVSQRAGFGELQPERDGAAVVARLRYLDLG